VHDLVQIGSGHRTLTEEKLKLAVLRPKLKLLPRQRRVALRDGKGGLRKTEGRAERAEKRPACWLLSGWD
jgi:hypothetical protein